MASSSLARPMAREMASFIAATWRLMVCPTDATDCSASRSGSASLHRDLGHGRGHEAKLLRAPDQQREEPEDDDGHENGDARR